MARLARSGGRFGGSGRALRSRPIRSRHPGLGGWAGTKSPAAPAASPGGGPGTLPPSVAAPATSGRRVHGVQGADPRHPALAFDVLEQRPVQVLTLSPGHGLDVADHNQQLLGARDGNVQPLRLFQEPDSLGLVAADQAENDDVRLLALEGIDGIDREPGQRHHPHLSPQMGDLVLIHGDHSHPQVLQPQPLQVADHPSHRLDLGPVREAYRSSLLLPAADGQPCQVPVERPGQWRAERRHLRAVAQAAVVRSHRDIAADGGRHPVLLVEHDQVGLRDDGPAQLEEARVADHRLGLVAVDGEGGGAFIQHGR